MRDDDLTSLFGPVISSYSRAQAIADGVLVDISDTARAAQFKVPVAMTAALWARCIETPARVSRKVELVWTWNLLYRVHWAIQAGDRSASRVAVEWDVPDDSGKTERVQFVVAIGPGDDAEPVMTLMFHDED
jgi:hypothetical protein